MNEYQYTNIHQYLVGISSTLSQLLKAQQRTNELLAAAQGAATPTLEAAPEAAPEPSEPWRNYDSMNIAEVLAKAGLVTDDERDNALAYERKHKNRRGILDKLENWDA